MPVVSACPKCGQYVTVPNDVLPGERVRCPHCAAAYPIEAVHGDPPPALIPVAVADENGEEAASLIVGETDEEAAELVADPVVDEEIAALEAADDEVQERDEGPWAEATAVNEPTVYDIRPPDGESLDGHAEDAKEPAVAAVYAEAFDFTPRRPNEENSAAAVAARLRQDSGRHGMFGELVKVILGGVVGLAIGYYLLNFLGGQRFDFLSVYLPGCPHTYHHWPGGENGAVEVAP